MTVLDLDLVQVGSEVTWGTPVTQTAKLMGIMRARNKPRANAKVYQDIRGSLAPAHIGAMTGVAGAATIEQLALYEDMLFVWENLLGKDTPSGTNPYTYQYAAPLGAQVVNPRFYTLTIGQTPNVWGLEGAVISSLMLRGSSGEQDTELTMSYDLLGQKVAVDTIDSLSDRTVNPIMASHASVFMDAWGGTIGSTSLPTTAVAFELGLNANRLLQYYLGSLEPQNFVGKRFAPDANKLKLSLEINSGGYADTLIDSLVGNTLQQRQIRLKFSNTSALDMQIDFAGTVVGTPELADDRAGLKTIDVEFVGTYNPTLANWLKIDMINGLSAVP